MAPYVALDLKENEMSRGMPSMVALLGLLALAGYQNREKIAEALGARNQGPQGGSGQGDQQSGGLGNLGGLLGGASAGSVLSGGLRDLVERFKEMGHGEAADSWVRRVPINRSARISSSRRSAPTC